MSSSTAPSPPLREAAPSGRPALVIFDCDGVLVDSEPISLAMLTGALNRIGVPISLEGVRERFAGTSMTSVMEHVERDYAIAAPAGFVETVKADTLSAFDRDLRAMEGVARAVAALDMPVCVASSSDPVRLNHSLTLTGLIALFHGRLYSSSMVARGKPFPDLFLHAAREMRAAPADCVVVEDSVPGVRAARAAGMRVIGFTGGGHWRADRSGRELAKAGAEAVFTDFCELDGLIAGGKRRNTG